MESRKKEVLTLDIKMKSSVLTLRWILRGFSVRLELLDFLCHFGLKSPHLQGEAEILVGMIHEYLVIMVHDMYITTYRMW